MIIGLSGYAQSGKDFTARTLTDVYGYERRAFADKIRKVLYSMNPDLPFDAGWGPNSTRLQVVVDLYGWDEVKQSTEVRRLLQALGVSMREQVGENVWINAALSDVKKNKNYVITDVRFPNEAYAIRDLGGKIWRVQRPGVSPVNHHVSETAMDGFLYDGVLHNTPGDIEGFEKQLKELLRDL